MGVGANKNYVHDIELLLEDGGADITADAAGQVASSDQILDLGAAFVEGDWILDFNTVDFVTGDERYAIKLQFSQDSGFASGIVDKLEMVKGDALLPSDTDKVATGREIIPFNNEIEGTVFRFCRLFVDVLGTTPILNMVSFLAKK